jgi:hypothetical protein
VPPRDVLERDLDFDEVAVGVDTDRLDPQAGQ